MTPAFSGRRSRREDDAVRLKRPDLFHRHLVVADDPDVRVQLSDHLVKVIGKTVVVVDEQDHRSTSSACFKALMTAAALLRHSSYSFSGTESATMPAPLRTNTFPFFL